MNSLSVRLAVPADLPALELIEIRCFRGSRRASRRSLRRSLVSPAQSVWLAVVSHEGRRLVAGAMILHHHARSIRIYSLAVLPAFRGSGAGRRLVRRAVLVARRNGCRAVTLEADRRNRVLTGWYERLGFEIVRVLKDYYSPGRHAVRMHRVLKQDQKSESVCGRS
ncbi:GNAT family N-acetyltransferase [Tichowtungia aerotolerans]|uniref:GNAT family N-acetyltransferase n=1 Tax=Tichowtungia aerotolerans TaxID=2697043 RepID=A0A6P1M9A0_9BACT|nr:N-acetyltransferase [Tichowtungia aerotolerans]QHI68658.1 GNAT family N-acetyltransferase [Tichowtungia aerotolerans]